MRSLALALVLCAALPARADAQGKKIDSARVALKELRKDPRRSKYRDGWEAVLRQFDSAARAEGPRAGEAALEAARVRAELFRVSRSPADARSALAALRKVDEDYPGPLGLEALHASVQLAWHTKSPGDRATAARRLIERYPESAEARAVAARTAAMQKPSLPPGNKPVDAGDDEDEDLPESEGPEAPPEKHGPVIKAVKDAVAALTEPEDAPAVAAKAREMRSAALSSGSSLAAQLGLKVRRVVIDPGHGGKDTGAIGPHRVREKDVALGIAKNVAARLRALGLAVIMTRKDDSFVSLDERTRIANESKADLFVSIHCNASRRRTLSGAETWTLNVGSDRYSARLAAFENAEADRTVSDLRLILADLAAKANAGDARELAQSVQSSLARKTRARDHGVKQALFYVLLGAHMPAVLVETGFISNPAEEARLKSRRFQEDAAEAISRGVKDFVDARRRLARAP
ncbi:MAG TPA: N-acetylmuramoyl-L-alanine amidase [Myxococcales bacterium]